MNNLSEPIVTIVTALIAVAIISVLVSKKSQTGNVLAAAGGAFSNAISAAVSPVTGNSVAPNVNAGSSSGGLSSISGGGLLSGGGFGLALNLGS
jgi:hypothetical protein